MCCCLWVCWCRSGAVLTLPGIAGIVLTMGMAVDANVIIFERVKEELRGGKGLALAIKDGFSNAYSAIIDGNLTTIITGLVLFFRGTGPVRGLRYHAYNRYHHFALLLDIHYAPAAGGGG